VQIYTASRYEYRVRVAWSRCEKIISPDGLLRERDDLRELIVPSVADIFDVNPMLSDALRAELGRAGMTSRTEAATIKLMREKVTAAEWARRSLRKAR
jgi:hypothetical protein